MKINKNFKKALFYLFMIVMFIGMVFNNIVVIVDFLGIERNWTYLSWIALALFVCCAIGFFSQIYKIDKRNAEIARKNKEKNKRRADKLLGQIKFLDALRVISYDYNVSTVDELKMILRRLIERGGLPKSGKLGRKK